MRSTNKEKISRTLICSLLIANLVIANLPIAHANEEKTNSTNERAVEIIQIFGSTNALDTATGSGHAISEEQLEDFEFDDIHRVLQSVPGVYIREEDGYGLRPNIGLRGATSERSSKIALMEDGVLLSPAPYSAPAAYFFPVVSRMSGVEVFKGPSAIVYGPNTVGGAINMISRPISERRTAQIDLAGGQQGYRKAHGFYSDTINEFGFLVEAINLHSDGFKDLGNNDATGFAKNEWVGKLRYTPNNDPLNQSLSLKVSYSDEVSNETYLGLSDSDFEKNPYLRYPASQKDKFDWEHLAFQASHYIELTPSTVLFTQAYRRDFNRDWDRLNSFAGNRTIESILRSPNTGINSLFFDVLTGERDSLTNDEALEFTLNDRSFYSQGLQTKLRWDTTYQNMDIELETGLRLHQDQVERLHRARLFNLVAGTFEFAGLPETILTQNKDKTSAIASYINSKFTFDELTLSLGLRAEHIKGEANDILNNTKSKHSDSIVLPGFGAFYSISEHLGFLIGINKGFVPNSPGQADNIEAEESWNYEFGLRANIKKTNIEAIGFYSDYSNLKGTCTFSSGCTTQLNQEFNGGEVDIYGLEFTASHQLMFASTWSMPISLAYTFTQSEFQNSFESDFSQWGSVTQGDELAYLPEHQINLQISLKGAKWQVNTNFKYISEMLESAGLNTELSGLSTESMINIDLSAYYQYNSQLKLYTKIDNLSDEINIVSRRPFGARPSKPRQVIAGIKYEF